MAALIGPRSPAQFPIMSADPKESPTPLAEISQGPNAFEAFLDRNQVGIVVLAIALVVGAAGLVVYRGIKASNEETAGAALTKAGTARDYQAVVSEHENTSASGSAMLLLANAQWTEGKQDDSIATLRKLIESHPGHAVIPTAKSSLASKLMSQGKSGDAAKLFEEVASDPTARFIAPFALISLGDIAKADGNLEKAESSYTKVTTEFSGSTFAETASRRISILKSKPPVEIEPPPAPPAPPAGDGTPATVPPLAPAPQPAAAPAGPSELPVAPKP